MYVILFQDRINGSGDNLGFKDVDSQLYELIKQSVEHRPIPPHEQLKGMQHISVYRYIKTFTT